MRTVAPLLLLCGMVALAMLAVGCDPGIDVVIENRTPETITLYFEPGADATAEVSLGPLEIEEYTLDESFWTDRLIARNAAGTVVFDEQMTWEELERTKRIVIEDNR